MTTIENAKDKFEEPPEEAMPDEDAEMPFFDRGEPSATTGSSKVAEVKRKHEGKLLKIDGVEGVSIESDEIGEDTIVVFVRDESVRRKVPRSLDGLSLRVEVTGEFDAFLSVGDAETPGAGPSEPSKEPKKKGKARGSTAKGKTRVKRRPVSLADLVQKDAKKPKATKPVRAKRSSATKAKPQRTTDTEK